MPRDASRPQRAREPLFRKMLLELGGWLSFLVTDSNLETGELHQLRSRIEAFELDDPQAVLPFTSRLAREHAWTHAFAARVVVEYKRFICLAMVAGHPVTPSEAVDQAWHLHLVYTKSYWQRFCRDVLGKELHHEPTQGGMQEGEKFTDWYLKTLESYQRIFGEHPPGEIWPDAKTRFANPAALSWVDRSRCWVIPKPFLSLKQIFQPNRK